MDQEQTHEKAQLPSDPGPWHIVLCRDRTGAPVWYVAHLGEPRYSAFLGENAFTDTPRQEDFFVLWVGAGLQPGLAAAFRLQAIEAVRQAGEEFYLQRMKVRRHEGRNHYDLLGVSRDASPEEIKTVYRALARRYHPDLQRPGEVRGGQAPPAGTDEWFKRLTAAYHTLSDPARKGDYDARLRDREGVGAKPSRQRRLRGRKIRRRDRIVGTLRGFFSPLRRC